MSLLSRTVGYLSAEQEAQLARVMADLDDALRLHLQLWPTLDLSAARARPGPG